MLLLLALALASGDPRTFEGTPVEQPWLPISHRRALPTRHLLEGDLVIDGERFPVREGSRALRLATRPAGEGLRRLRDGGRATLSWEAQGEPRSIELLLEQQGERWWYGAGRATRVDLDGLAIVLVDADGDGRLDLLHDGWSLAPGTPVHPLAGVLRLEDRLLRITELDPGGAALGGEVEPLAGPPEALEALALLNRLRLGEGLGALLLEPDLSAACAEHAAYLLARGWRGGPGGRDQEPGAEGASRAGREAALRSEVLSCTPARAVLELWGDTEGRLLLADPDLVAVGIAGGAGAAIIDARARQARDPGRAAMLSSPRTSPAHGAPAVPTAHGTLAVTTPVEDAGRMGPPLLLLLGDQAGGVEDYELELAEVESGRRRLEVVPLPPLDGHRAVRGALPRSPLAPGRLHLAVHRWVRDGEPQEARVLFRTAAER